MAEEMNRIKVPKRILNTLLASLTAGVVPRTGAPYIAIGRKEEIATLLDDFSAVGEGGAACRFLIGRYGSGKSFLIQLLRGYALDRGFLCADADLSPERRLTGGNGAGLATYRELMMHLSSKASPEGGALSSVLSRHFVRLKNEIVADGILPEDEKFESELKKRVILTLSASEESVGGFDFARVLGAYYAASLADDAEKKSACLRWLRGEFATRTEAKAALGFSVGTVIGDDNWYDFVKLFAAFATKLGYAGLILFIDECIDLYKIPNRISREANYEKILTIFNDTMQGRASSLGVIFGGTPQFLEDTRRGLFSYEALRSRLADSRYTELGYRDLSSPVIRLRRLSDNELLALIRRLTKLYMQREETETPPLSDEEIERFLRISASRAGAEELLMPREMIRDYLSLLNILRDNKDLHFDDVMKDFEAKPTQNFSNSESENDTKNDKKQKISLFDLEF